jgi:hypothetical protein
MRRYDGDWIHPTLWRSVAGHLETSAAAIEAHIHAALLVQTALTPFVPLLK